MFFGSNDKTFFELFEKAADNMVLTARLFRELLQQFDRRHEVVEQLREAEHHGDFLTHETIARLNQTFITPLDREDIYALITQTDEVVDCLEAAGRRIILYRVDRPNEDILKQADNALEITQTLALAIKSLRNLKKQQRELGVLLVEIHTLENRGDEHNHRALGRLFESDDPMYVLKWKELYDLVEQAVDACETVANTINSVVMKNA